MTILVTCFLKVTSMCSVKNAEHKHGMACFVSHTRYSRVHPHAWEPRASSAMIPRSPSCLLGERVFIAAHTPSLPLARTFSLAAVAAWSLWVRKPCQVQSSVGKCAHTHTCSSLILQMHVHCNIKISFCLNLVFLLNCSPEK